MPARAPGPGDRAAPPDDHRRRPRRRGKALDEAIFQATLDELDENGYANLTMERVAERARAGKASLYRRWPSRVELVMDAASHAFPDPSSPIDTGTLRGDLLAALRGIAQLRAGPAGEALRGVLSDVLSDPARTAEARRRSQGRGRRAIELIVRRAVERGEIDGTAVTPRRVEAGPALLRHRFLFNGVPIPDEVIVEIVDEVMLPLFGCAPGP
jgi:AcrR family transcriptional regulator